MRILSPPKSPWLCNGFAGQPIQRIISGVTRLSAADHHRRIIRVRRTAMGPDYYRPNRFAWVEMDARSVISAQSVAIPRARSILPLPGTTPNRRFPSPLPFSMNSPLILPGNTLAKLDVILNRLLAGEYLLYFAVRDYRWNVSGPDALKLHQLLGIQAHEIDGRLDRLAWRIGMLGGRTKVSPTDLGVAGWPAAAPGAGLSVERMLDELGRLQDELIARLRATVDLCQRQFSDPVTTELLADLVVYHERDAWVLRAMRWDQPPSSQDHTLRATSSR